VTIVGAHTLVKGTNSNQLGMKFNQNIGLAVARFFLDTNECNFLEGLKYINHQPKIA